MTVKYDLVTINAYIQEYTLNIYKRQWVMVLKWYINMYLMGQKSSKVAFNLGYNTFFNVLACS